MNRKTVYKLIDGERNYQDNCIVTDPRRSNGDAKAVGEYLVMMDHYLRRAMDDWTQTAGSAEALKQVRKIAAIAVRCMEEHATTGTARVSTDLLDME